MMRRMLRTFTLVAVAAAALGACSGGGEPSRDASGAVTGAGTVSVFDLREGDCLDPPTDLSGEIADIKLVPCDDPHTQEVFGKVEATDDAYPGAEALATEASGACAGLMQQPPLGLSPDDGYFWSYLLPSFNGWNKDNDRTMVCVFVFPQQGSVTGSVVAQAKAGTVRPGSPPPVSAVPPTLRLSADSPTLRLSADSPTLRSGG
ncbi:MAG: septum formation family protein [Ilumatobacteraceae bacterium]